jgi:hypothetical protein
VISIRVSQETAKRIRTLSESSGKSLATLIKENLGTQERKEKKIEKEISKAYNKGADDNKIWYYCAGCRKRINISPNSADHKALIQYMEEHGWGHKTCIG